MKKATADVLALYGISDRLLEESLRRNLQIEDAAALLNESLRIDIDDVEPVPPALTSALYETIMIEFEGNLHTAVENYHGEMPVPPCDLVVLLLRVYDGLKEKYGFSEFELAAAGKMYKTRSVLEIGRKIQEEVGKITKGKPVKAL